MLKNGGGGRWDNLDLLDSLAHAIGQRAPMRTELYKVRAHIGCEGNELADK